MENEQRKIYWQQPKQHPQPNLLKLLQGGQLKFPLYFPPYNILRVKNISCYDVAILVSVWVSFSLLVHS